MYVTQKCGQVGVRARGFTLVELLTVIAIGTALTTMTVGALSKVQNSARFSNSSAEIAQGLRRTRAEALGRGVPTVFLVDTVRGKWWGFEAPTGFNLNTFDPALLVPGAVGAPTLFLSGTLPREVAFGPGTGFGTALPAPFSGVPVTGLSLNYCSFCSSGTNTGYGSMLFQAGAPVQFSQGAAGSGQQFTLIGTTDTGSRTVTVALAGRSGAIAAFER